MIVFIWEVIRITDDYSMLQCKTCVFITINADIFVIISKTYYVLMTKPEFLAHMHEFPLHLALLQKPLRAIVLKAEKLHAPS
jgi:hypothetical protein